MIDESFSPKELFKKLRLDWLDSYQFEDAALALKIDKTLLPILKSPELFHSKKWTGAYYKRQILSNYCPNLMTKWMGPGVGFGLFAQEKTPSHSFIGTYLGTVRSRSFFKENHISAYAFSFPIQPKCWFGSGGWRWTIDAMRSGNHTRFINHSTDGNCEAVAAICDNQIYIVIRAKRIIEPGEQLLYDYGENYWKNRSTEPQGFL